MARILFNHSRRTQFDICKFWKRNEENIGDSDKLIHNKKPDGLFFARLVNVKSKQEGNINGVILFSKDTTILYSTDDLKDLERGDLILFRGEMWLVESVQNQQITKESQYFKEESFVYYINLRK